MAHSLPGGDHTAGGGLKGLDGALLQSQLVCLLYVAFSVCITMYRGTCVEHVAAGIARRPLTAPLLSPGYPLIFSHPLHAALSTTTVGTCPW